MADEIPEFAQARACELANAARVTSSSSGPFIPADCFNSPSLYAFARYIAEHEEPPVDPLLIEAREIAASKARTEIPRIQYTNGFRDGDRETQIALAALRRGVEIGRDNA